MIHALSCGAPPLANFLAESLFLLGCQHRPKLFDKSLEQGVFFNNQIEGEKIINTLQKLGSVSLVRMSKFCFYGRGCSILSCVSVLFKTFFQDRVALVQVLGIVRSLAASPLTFFLIVLAVIFFGHQCQIVTVNTSSCRIYALRILDDRMFLLRGCILGI